MAYTIYLVEDESNLNRLLCSYLEKEGWTVCSFTNGAEAQKAIKDRPNLWILDIMLPDIDGYQLLKEIKEDFHHTPVIYISARDAELDRVIGLELGCDDYLPKPFLPRELIIRSRNLLTRQYGGETNLKFEFPPYCLDEERRIVSEGECVIDLTAREFDLLLYFIQHMGHALSRQQLLDQLWGMDYVSSDRVVDDLVRRLRRKMSMLRVETIYGYGYRMVQV